MGSGAGLFLVVVLSWGIPIFLIYTLFRTLGTIVEGLRSINDATQRTALAVEELVRRQDESAAP